MWEKFSSLNFVLLHSSSDSFTTAYQPASLRVNSALHFIRPLPHPHRLAPAVAWSTVRHTAHDPIDRDPKDHLSHQNHQSSASFPVSLSRDFRTITHLDDRLKFTKCSPVKIIDWLSHQLTSSSIFGIIVAWFTMAAIRHLLCFLLVLLAFVQAENQPCVKTINQLNQTTMTCTWEHKLRQFPGYSPDIQVSALSLMSLIILPLSFQTVQSTSRLKSLDNLLTIFHSSSSKRSSAWSAAQTRTRPTNWPGTWCLEICQICWKRNWAAPTLRLFNLRCYSTGQSWSSWICPTIESTKSIRPPSRGWPVWESSTWAATNSPNYHRINFKTWAA